ncbi:MAG: VapE domain-containing protein [Myxococcota bacterium]
MLPDDNAAEMAGLGPVDPETDVEPAPEAPRPAVARSSGEVRPVDNAPDEVVAEQLRMGRQGPKSCPVNLDLIFEQDPRWAGRVRFSDLDGRLYLGEERLEDESVGEARLWLNRVYDITASMTNVDDALKLVGRRHRFHPIRNYLTSLRWDGKQRIDQLLRRYAGAEDTPLNRTLGKRFLIGLVARAFLPGCKLDTMLVLFGRQGTMKSTFLRILAVNDCWFCDTPLDLRSKDAMENIRGKWLVEFQECHTLLSAPPTRVKAFLSSARDTFRLPYGRRSADYPRQSAFAGTTNIEEFIEDSTGSRRFWPVRSGTVDIEALARDRDQLWAEAVAAFRERERWHLVAEEAAMLERASVRFRREDTWKAAVAHWAEGRQAFTTGETLMGAIGKPLERVRKADEMRVAEILKELGYRKEQRSVDGIPAHRWYPPKQAIDEAV